MEEKKQVETGLIKALAMNQGQHEAIAQEYAPTLGVPAEELKTYLASFIYRLGQPEEEAINQFKRLVDEHHLL